MFTGHEHRRCTKGILGENCSHGSALISFNNEEIVAILALDTRRCGTQSDAAHGQRLSQHPANEPWN